MANKPKSLWLTERTMSGLRGDEALSGRINQIVDRYLHVIESEREGVLALIGEEGLADLVRVWPDVAPRDRWIEDLRVALKAVNSWSDATSVELAVQMTDTELVVLAEIVEAERMVRVPGDS